MTNTYFPSPTSRMLSQNWSLILLRGIFGVLFGLLALFFPGPTMLSLVFVFAAYMVLDAISALVATFRAVREHRQWGWLLVQAIASLTAAAAATFWPGITVLVFVLLTAAWSIVSGSLMFAAALAIRENGRWWLILGAIASLIYGMLMIFLPLVGALVLTWWIGAYALVFGVSLIVLAFSLRRAEHETHGIGAGRAAA